MSNPLAIAAVTATLRNVLFQGVSSVLAGTQVTARPPDRARSDITGNQLNLFLYRTSVEAAWRNEPLPTQTRPGEDGYPPLPLTLHYLLTAYSDNDDEVLGNQIIGRAVSVLHDRPLLDPASIRTALPGNDLHLQIERVRLTNSQLTEDELFRLWTAFQTEYRFSVAYEASVVLIESARAPDAGLPITQRGAGDTGPASQASVDSPLPLLVAVVPPDQRPVALAGDELTLEGANLSGASVSVRFAHPLLGAPVVLGPGDLVAADDGSVRVNLPAALPAGYVTVAVLVTDAGGAERSTNELAFGLAPRLTNAPMSASRNAEGIATISAAFEPDVRPEQNVWLITGSEMTPAPARAADSSSIAFAVPLAAGSYPVRLRADGVDSPLIDYSATPPAYDPDQRVDVS